MGTQANPVECLLSEYEARLARQREFFDDLEAKQLELMRYLHVHIERDAQGHPQIKED